MDSLHGRAGPGARKRGRGLPGKLPSTPDQPPSASESAFVYVTASDWDSTTLLAGLKDISSAEKPGTPADAPEGLPGGAESGWHDVDGRRYRLVIRRELDGGRLGRFIQDLLMDVDFEGPPLEGDNSLTGVREPHPVLPGTGDAVVIPDSRELVHE